MVTENALVQQSQSFEQAVRGGEREAMVAFCDQKAGSAAGNETETWAFLKILFESDPQRCVCSSTLIPARYHILHSNRAKRASSSAANRSPAEQALAC